MQKDKKELTPEQIRQRKKLLVMPLFGLLFLGSLYWIFAPSEDKEQKPGQSGYNAEVPAARTDELPDKKKAYERSQLNQIHDERMRSLQDFALLTGKNDSIESLDFDLKPDVTPHKKESFIENSGTAFRNIESELQNFYTPEPDRSKEKELERRIEELTEKLNEQQNEPSPMDKQILLMEKSYQMAAKYLTPTAQPEAKPVPPPAADQRKPNAIAVASVIENVVSALPQPISDSAFIRQMEQRTTGFLTVAASGGQTVKNTIRASLYEQRITNGQTVKLRLLEPIQIGSLIIPENTELSGSSALRGERLNITITTVQFQNSIYSVGLTVYDTDGIAGILVPNSLETDATQEAMANIGGNLGQSITVNRNAGQQIASDLTRGAIQAGTQYLNAKTRQIKINLKAGYQVLLLPKN